MTSYNSACKINSILFLPRVPVINLLPVGSKFTLQYLPHHWDNELDFLFCPASAMTNVVSRGRERAIAGKVQFSALISGWRGLLFFIPVALSVVCVHVCV